ncbi:ATP-binding cassette domain-containing protein [Lachnoclostridium sp. An181]|uniref:ATP-binding cassette domain-containing protein n=1 Tax=Lachnoclostridium sp. An181 TaxID=1965575 RepID=UPI000B368D92|nr:ABC transporter ATP-binding protein [Lachnoclostridium sp. An181]OUP51282.1 multidrug ABC transporter ATP-binding protein [Lachnoclostridium sp. An181]
MKAIRINNLTKDYKRQNQPLRALDHVSLNFEFGKIYGLLGRNGAGKSTLINILCNRIFATEGTVDIDGMSAFENPDVHEKIYCMSEGNLCPDSFSVKEVFKWTSEFYSCFDMEKALTLSEMFGLNVRQKVKKLSTGYKSIYKIITALSLNVPYLIFDEPVLGLDANHRELFYKLLLSDYEKNPRTIVIATHLIEEVSSLIEEIIIIDNGRVLLSDTAEHLLAKGYSIAGTPANIDAYCKGKDVVGYDEIAGMKIAYILGDVQEDAVTPDMHISTINLQKLFVKLTERGGKPL